MGHSSLIPHLFVKEREGLERGKDRAPIHSCLSEYDPDSSLRPNLIKEQQKSESNVGAKEDAEHIQYVGGGSH